MAERCILYVEDEEEEVLLTRRAFQSAGIRQPLNVVTDGRQAITYLTEWGLGDDASEIMVPCLVLLDLHLPGLSGLEVLEWIRSQPALGHLVVILSTSSQDPRHVAHAYKLRVNSFINKPGNLEKRQEFARLLKGWWLDLNQCPTVDETVSNVRQQLEFAPFSMPARRGVKPGLGVRVER
jgi:two-component system, response regulator